MNNIEEYINFLQTVETFVASVMPKIRSREKVPSFNILFNEDGINFLQDTKKYLSKFTNCTLGNSDIEYLKIQDDFTPTIIINNHYNFFWNLTQLSTEFISFTSCKRDNIKFLQMDLLQKIWLRMVPTDFSNVEEFLERQIRFLKDDTFKKFHSEVTIGKLGDYEIRIKDTIGQLYDENFKIMRIRIMSKDGCHDLPSIHYDIDGDTCYIGAIQNKLNRSRIKKVERILYKLNKNILESVEYNDYKNGISNYYPENISDVHPNFIFSLAIFFDLLQQAGIKKIKVPALHVLSYEYHTLLSDNVRCRFNYNYGNYDEVKNKTPQDFIDDDFEYFESEKEVYEHYVDKEDYISKNKTENLFRVFRRLQFHFPNIIIKNIPMIESDYVEISFDNIKILEMQMELEKYIK